jgi:uncharacterized protein YbjT (DUF2867 family)
MLKTIFVTGATGNQGGAVCRELIRKGFEVKALTRKAGSPAAQALAQLGVQVLQGDLDTPDSYSAHLNGVDGVFSVQSFGDGTIREIYQGTSLASRARSAGVPHFLYSSVVGSDLHTGIPHWESKAVIEKHVRDSGMPFTILRPASLFENFLIPQVKSRLLKSKLVSPVDKHIVQQFVASADIGRMAAKVFSDPGHFKGQTIMIAAEQMDLLKAAGIFSEALGYKVTYSKLPGIITRLAMGRDLYRMFQWINRNGGVFRLGEDTAEADLDGMLSLRDWIPLHFKAQ